MSPTLSSIGTTSMSTAEETLHSVILKLGHLDRAGISW